MRMMAKGESFIHVEADSGDVPTFSEAFLYPTVGKGDARFILGVGEEYEHVIQALGPAAVKAILELKPALVQRLGTGVLVTDNLEDARDETNLDRYKRYPPQIIIGEDVAYSIWQVLHSEYRRWFEPEKSMPKEQYFLYLDLTERLGEITQDQKTKVDEARPEQVKRAKERNEKRKALRVRLDEVRQRIDEALEGNDDPTEVLREAAEVLEE